MAIDKEDILLTKDDLSELKKDVSLLKTDVANAKVAIIKWMLTIGIAEVVLIVSLVKLL